MQAIIDTNCLLLSIPPKNLEFWLYESFRNKDFTWVLSTEIIAEYEEMIGVFYSPKTANIVLEILLSAPNVRLIEPYFRWQLVQDADDNKFVDTAIAANADYIVSQDKHLHFLKKLDYPKLNIVKIHQFEKIIRKSKA
jgi:putative PIN family toxin of toxin-antitoxin system